jgi:hypothetical protein
VEKTCGNQVPQHTYSQTHDSRQTQRGKPPLVQSKQNERKRKDQLNNKILKHLKTPPNPTLTEHTDPSDTKKQQGKTILKRNLTHLPPPNQNPLQNQLSNGRNQQNRDLKKNQKPKTFGTQRPRGIEQKSFKPTWQHNVLTLKEITD